MVEKMKFEDAIEYVLQWEGSEYSDDKNDKGGETKWGISKRAHPDVDIKNLTKKQAFQIYKKEYWDKYKFDAIPEEFQLKLFDMTVNMGFKGAIICLQRALNTLNAGLIEDGILGEKTLSSLKNILDHWGYSMGLFCALKSERAAYYRVLAAQDPSQKKFLAGWLRRAYS